MELSINTPALLFPAISLLMLAYTNRFLALASLIRNLHSQYNEHSDKEGLFRQIKNLRLRLRQIRLMQAFGVMSLFLCVLSMFFIYERLPAPADYTFPVILRTSLEKMTDRLVTLLQPVQAAGLPQPVLLRCSFFLRSAASTWRSISLFH